MTNSGLIWGRPSAWQYHGTKLSRAQVTLPPAATVEFCGNGPVNVHRQVPTQGISRIHSDAVPRNSQD